MAVANFDGNFSGRPVVLRLEVTYGPQDVPNNRTLISSWRLLAIKNGNTTAFSANANTWAVNIGGIPGSGTWTYDFSAIPIGNAVIIASGGGFYLNHNADGTLTPTMSASADGSVGGGLIGTAACSGSVSFPTIPRASTPTYSDSTPDAGDAITITTNRASGSFLHDLSYRWQGSGSGYTTIANGVGASTGWTVPSSLINDIPAAVSRVLEIRTVTKSGSTTIGTTLTTITVGVPASVIPGFGTVTHDEAVAAVDTAVGAYVQGLSKLDLAITSAVAGTGSTIASQKIEVVGQPANTINAGSGTTPQPLEASGTVTLRGTVTDARGRSHSEDVTITVLAYSLPTVTAIQLRRAFVDGTPDEEGTYIRVDIDAAVQSLVVSAVQKNELTYRISTRANGASTWTEQAEDAVGAITFDDHVEVGTYPVDESFDVLVEVLDKFTTVQLAGTVGTAAVFLHLGNAGEGLGIGNYWQELDALKPASLVAANWLYHRGNKLVADEDDLVAAIAEAIAGARVPAGFTGHTASRNAPTGWLKADGSAVSRTTYADLYAATNEVIGNPTVTIASPGVFTLTAHGLFTGDQVALTTTGALPTGLAVETDYYVIRVTADTFRLATSRANANAGTAINTSGTQSGTHTIRTSYGVGNGSTTFNVPNIPGRTIVARDTGQTEFDAMGETGGAKTHTLTTAEMPSHSHTQRFILTAQSGGDMGGMAGAGSPASTDAQQVTATAGSGGAHNNLQPYITLTAIIKT